MDSIIICIAAYPNVVVPMSLVIPHIRVEHAQDLSIEYFSLAIGIQMVGLHELTRYPHHHPDTEE